MLILAKNAEIMLLPFTLSLVNTPLTKNYAQQTSKCKHFYPIYIKRIY